MTREDMGKGGRPYPLEDALAFCGDCACDKWAPEVGFGASDCCYNCEQPEVSHALHAVQVALVDTQAEVCRLTAELGRANISAQDWMESFEASVAEQNTLRRERDAVQEENVTLRNQNLVTSHMQREIDDLRRESGGLRANLQKHRWACKSCGSMGATQIEYPEGDWDMACLACGSVHTDDTAEVLIILAGKVKSLTDVNLKLEGMLLNRTIATPSNETAGTTRVGPRVQSFYHAGLGKY